MKPIYVDKSTKGILVHAKPNYGNRDWLILIHHIDEERDDDKKVYHIKRHISYCLETKETYISEYPGNWGYIKGYTLYEPTEEDKEIIKNIMKKRRYRFIKILNKLKKVYV